MFMYCIIALVVLGLACAVVVAARRKDLGAADRVFLGMLPLAGLLLGMRLVQCVAVAPFHTWNDVRMAPTVGLVHGYGLYAGPRSGPIQSTMYTPMSALSYLPAALASEPKNAMRAAAVLALLYYLLPPLVLFLGQARWAGGGRPAGFLPWYGAWAFAIITFADTFGLGYSASHVHADAPALGLSLAACAALVLGARGGSPGVRAAVVAAALGWLSVWSKQVMLPTLLALQLWALLAHGPRYFWKFLLINGAVGLLISAAFVGAFGAEGMALNAFGVPGRYPWRLVASPGFPGQGVWEGGVPHNVAGNLLGLVNRCAFFVMVILIHVLDRAARGETGRREWFAENGWALPVLAALVSIPTSVLGLVKVSGCANSLSPTLYLLAAGYIAMLIRGHARTGGREAGVGGPATLHAGLIGLSALFVYVMWAPEATSSDFNTIILCALAASALLHLVDRARDLGAKTVGFVKAVLVTAALGASWAALHGVAGTANRLDATANYGKAHNFTRTAYDYIRTHPHRAYFPLNPLAHLMAEGTLYHFLGSVHEWEVAQHPVALDHFRAHLPPQFEVICYPTDPESYGAQLHRFFPEHSEPVAIPALSQFRCYRRPGGAFAPTGQARLDAEAIRR